MFVNKSKIKYRANNFCKNRATKKIFM
ncbi:hypothetical protein VCHA48O428_300008 [Vibrio chagasii]|nr:hypothetical protein VCHA48O428_300008 [Vibrio chagasii]CAH7251190.1 hypothetical protein VCHA54P495_360008 [Vibrio chagasii]CAH7452576.1 hypothetical protein VCHA54P486_400024 [Vibrio chagasii]